MTAISSLEIPQAGPLYFLQLLFMNFPNTFFNQFITLASSQIENHLNYIWREEKELLYI